MTKTEFLEELKARLEGLPDGDVSASLDYYGEMLDDLMESGMAEEEAVASLGTAEAVAEQILLDTPLPKLVKARVKPKRRMRTWEVVLLAVGSPVWAPILLALGVVALAVYVSLWAVVISIYAVDLALGVGAVFGVGVGIGQFILAAPINGILLLAAGLVCGGLTVFLFFGCVGATKGALWLAKKMVLGVKKCFVKKEMVA